MNSDEIAWFAGLFEGEGHIGFVALNSIILNIVMTDKDIIERCGKLFPESCVYGPIDKGSGRKIQWGWRVMNAVLCKDILEEILPYLGYRRGERAKAALLRLKNVRKEGYCKRNHPMSGDNLYISPGRGQRHCRACQEIRYLERKHNIDKR